MTLAKSNFRKYKTIFIERLVSYRANSSNKGVKVILIDLEANGHQNKILEDSALLKKSVKINSPYNFIVALLLRRVINRNVGFDHVLPNVCLPQTNFTSTIQESPSPKVVSAIKQYYFIQSYVLQFLSTLTHSSLVFVFL